jgi:integrase
VAKSVAEEKLDIKRSEVIRGEWKPKKIQISFDKFKEEYLELTRGDKKPKSSLRDECSLKHLSKAFDGKMLSEINPLFIEKYRKTWKEEEAEPAKINHKLTVTLENAKKLSTSEYVFSENGKPYRDVKTGWWTALKKAKIESFRFHDLRHTFGSRLGMAGIDIRTIQELMGHKDIKMTMRYSHPTPEHKKKAVEILSETVSKTVTGVSQEKSQKVVNIGNH